MRNRLSPRFDPVEVVKVVVFKVLRVTSSKYARIKRKFTQKPIFNYLDYLGGVSSALFFVMSGMLFQLLFLSLYRSE